MKLHLKQLLDRFNASHFLFYCCLLVLVLLVGLRGDQVINWSYGVVFLPLWLWNMAVLAGLVGAMVAWACSKESRQEEEHSHHITALLLSVGLQSLLWVAEVLIAVNIDTGGLPWSAAFSPLYLLAVASVPACIWSCWRRRRVELELLAILNLLQLVILGLQLDGHVSWSWAVVFIPVWLLLGAFVVGEVLYLVIVLLSYTLAENQQAMEERKLPDFILLFCSAIFSISLIVFMALLASRLDGSASGPYSAILIPLHVALFSLLVSTFTRYPANPWWFGVKKNASDFALECFPLLQELANVSFNRMREEEEEEERERPENDKGVWWRKRPHPPTVEQVPLSERPLEDIYSPE